MSNRLAVLWSILWGVRAVGPAWVRWQVVVVKLGELWAADAGEGSAELLLQERNGLGREWVRRQDVWKTHLNVLVGKAGEVVTLEQIIGAVYAVGEVRDVDASVCVRLSKVTTKAEGVWIGGELGEQIAKDTSDGSVALGTRAAVPVL